jgi:hypothetical protein
MSKDPSAIADAMRRTARQCASTSMAFGGSDGAGRASPSWGASLLYSADGSGFSSRPPAVGACRQEAVTANTMRTRKPTG